MSINHRINIFLLFVLFPFLGKAQSTLGLKAYYSFDDCDTLAAGIVVDDTAGGSDGAVFGAPTCACGISGSALRFDGVNDYVIFFGLINTAFSDDDFSISFYYKPEGGGFQRSLISKREFCDEFDYIDIRAQPSQGRISVEINEDNTSKIRSIVNTEDNTCWQHYVVTRNDQSINSYINGVLMKDESSNFILNFQNNAVLSLSDSPCIGEDGTGRFKGLVDELRIYNRELNQGEINELYIEVDKIGNRQDTVVFLGGSVDIYNSRTCAAEFSWSPTEGVSDPSIGTPTITPDTTTTYTLTFTDSLGCDATDTIRIKIVDPSLLGCDNVFLPKAFSPNGDGINDNYHISNPQVIDEFISLEIFNRWGIRVYQSENGLEAWDGTFNGQELNPGVFVYQLRFICQGDEVQKAGSITLIK